MIELIMPPEVACAERFSDSAEDPLFPEERNAIERAVDGRRREFATGRACARSALTQLGLPPTPIPRGKRGAAAWPTGVTGSITHCVGYRGAVAANTSQVATLGIDAEPNQPLPDGVLPIVSSTSERDRIDLLPPTVCWDRLLFSAKEAVYKAWFPLTGSYLDFSEADLVIHVNPAQPTLCGTFSARLLVPGPVLEGRTLQVFYGDWLASRGLLLNAVVVRSNRVRTHRC